jgi:polyisoprenoid-binding protein YceI
MIRLTIFSAIISLGIIYSCAGPEGKKANIGEADTIVANTEGADKYIIDTATGVVEWKGFKPTGQHNGTLKIKSGALYIKENTPVGGEFVIDMNSLKVLDITDPEFNGKLTGHLRSPDFFNVEANPEANFVITQIVRSKESKTTYTLSGNLTIKGITKSVSFLADVTAEGDTFNASTPEFTIDRAAYDIRFKSKKFFDDLKDDFINDEIALVIKLSGKKSM